MRFPHSRWKPNSCSVEQIQTEDSEGSYFGASAARYTHVSQFHWQAPLGLDILSKIWLESQFGVVVKAPG